ncbi:hypothetical protein UPYG_G00229200 [Umbra pygmaea]|uniref:Zinc finger protein 593 n=1 Tax=Umbra pygmaea TaxID=75934 RepID=A0ABD0WZ71_UMBPY
MGADFDRPLVGRFEHLLQRDLQKAENEVSGLHSINMGKSKQIGNHNSTRKKSIGKTWKTKRYTKHLDEIHADMKPSNAAKLLKQEVDHDVTGSAQHYCLHCARYFVDAKALKEHFRTKLHKKRIKLLKEEPYSHAEAERAAGMGSYVAHKTVEVKTQTIEEDMD